MRFIIEEEAGKVGIWENRRLGQYFLARKGIYEPGNKKENSSKFIIIQLTSDTIYDNIINEKRKQSAKCKNNNPVDE